MRVNALVLGWSLPTLVVGSLVSSGCSSSEGSTSVATGGTSPTQEQGAASTGGASTGNTAGCSAGLRWWFGYSSIHCY